MNYQQQTLAVMNSVDLVVALYDGMVRFLHRAIERIEEGDVAGRRDSIRRVLDILTYLQARLRTDIGGEPAAALAEFYAATYAQCVRGSRDASVPLLMQSIRDILNVRDAWKQIAHVNPPWNPAAHGQQGGHTTTLAAQAADSSIDKLGAHTLLSIEPESHRWSA